MTIEDYITSEIETIKTLNNEGGMLVADELYRMFVEYIANVYGGEIAKLARLVLQADEAVNTDVEV